MNWNTGACFCYANFRSSNRLAGCDGELVYCKAYRTNLLSLRPEDQTNLGLCLQMETREKTDIHRGGFQATVPATDMIISKVHSVIPCSAVLVWSFLQHVFLFRQWMFPDYDYYLMAHAQKPIFFFRLNGQVQVYLHGVKIQSAIGSLAVCFSVRILYTGFGGAFFRIRAELTIYLPHSPLTLHSPR
jgi:hypothetical protein